MRILYALLAALFLASQAQAASTINTTIPATGAALSAAPIRNNFTAAANDINNILQQFSGTSAPSSPSIGQDWLNTTATPFVWSKWMGSAWVPVGSFDTGAGVFTPTADLPAFPSRAAAIAARIPGTIVAITLQGYGSPGDGGQGAVYVRTANTTPQPYKFQSADGQWWTLGNAVLSPEMLGAVGNGVADDTTALNNALAAANNLACNAKGGTLQMAGNYLISAATSVTACNNFAVIGQGGNATIHQTGAATYTGMTVTGLGTGGNSVINITANTSVWTTSLQVAATGTLSAGQYIQIQNATGTNAGADFRGMVNRINSVVDGTHITVTLPIAFPINTANSATILVAALTPNVRIENLTFDGTGYTGNGVGLSAAYLSEFKIRTIYANNFGATGAHAAEGIVGQTLYGGRIEMIRSINTAATGSNALDFQYVSNVSMSQWQVHNAFGLGISCAQCSNNTISDWFVERPAYRGIRFSGSNGNMMYGIRSNDAQNGEGMSFAMGSSNNRVYNFEAVLNSTQGLLLNGTCDLNNTFDGVMVQANGTQDVYVQATAPCADTGNAILNIDSRANTLQTDATSPTTFALVTGSPTIVPMAGTFQASNFQPGTGVILDLSGTTPVPQAALTGNILRGAGANAAQLRIEGDTWGNSFEIAGVRAEGTRAVPTATAAGSDIIAIGAYGFGTAYTTSRSGSYRIQAMTTWSGSNGATQHVWAATPPGSGSSSVVATLDGKGHMGFQAPGAAPVISACGTSPSAASGNDTSGSVTEGTAATGCTITFSNSGFTAAPTCQVTLSSATAIGISTLNTTTLTVTHASISSNKLYWTCFGN